MVLFAQLDDQVVGGGFLGLGPGAVARAKEEDRIGLTAEVVAQDVEGAAAAFSTARNSGAAQS